MLSNNLSTIERLPYEGRIPAGVRPFRYVLFRTAVFDGTRSENREVVLPDARHDIRELDAYGAP